MAQARRAKLAAIGALGGLAAVGALVIALAIADTEQHRLLVESDMKLKKALAEVNEFADLQVRINEHLSDKHVSELPRPDKTNCASSPQP
jgi:hypothetical protein